jgi:hypothetical protein
VPCRRRFKRRRLPAWAFGAFRAQKQVSVFALHAPLQHSLLSTHDLPVG